MRTEILFEDDNIIVIYKPPGIATQSKKTWEKDVVSELKNYLMGKGKNKTSPYISVIHRLDQPVGGLLVFAKDKESAAHLTKDLGTGSLNKDYIALVCGKVKDKEKTLTDFIAKGKDNKAYISAKENEPGDFKKAVLDYRVMEEINIKGNIYTKLKVHIETGRFHQIRCQLANMGNPVAGDIKYGAPVESKECVGLSSVGLWAVSLTFKHPKTYKNMSFHREPDIKGQKE
ncbi:MAG: RluA family pseudouridine synthase [Lachnospiraceae bacterium]|nr:RluA family pseudouridine synthase [Lachnospiraceae bacterium]